MLKEYIYIYIYTVVDKNFRPHKITVSIEHLVNIFKKSL